MREPDYIEAGDANAAEANEPKPLSHPCPCCGGRMIIIREVSARLLAAPTIGDVSTAVIRIEHITDPIGARRHPKTSRLLRRLSTGHDPAHPRATLDSRRVVRSSPRDSISHVTDRLTRLVASWSPSKQAFNAPRQQTASVENPHTV